MDTNILGNDYTCGNCKHWNTDRNDTEFQHPNFGICMKIVHNGLWTQHREEPESLVRNPEIDNSVIAVVCDAEPRWAELSTRHNFGCVLFESMDEIDLPELFR